MLKRQPPKQYNVAELQPDDVNALRALVREFIGRIETLDTEIEGLKKDRKDLIEEYSDRLDMKTLQAALKVLRIKQSVQHSDTFDLFIEALTNPAQ